MGERKHTKIISIFLIKKIFLNSLENYTKQNFLLNKIYFFFLFLEHKAIQCVSTLWFRSLFFFLLLISFFRLCGKSLSCLKISRTKLSAKKKKSPLLPLHSHEQINRLKKSSLSRERAGQGLIPQLKSALRPQKELYIVCHLAENMR